MSVKPQRWEGNKVIPNSVADINASFPTTHKYTCTKFLLNVLFDQRFLLIVIRWFHNLW